TTTPRKRTHGHPQGPRAGRPTGRPPPEEQTRARGWGSAGAEREPPRSAAIDFNPTALIQSEPNESDRSMTEMPATSHDVRVSMLGACKVGPGGLKGRRL